MLDDMILRRIRADIEANLDPRNVELAAKLSTRTNELAARGLGISGAAVQTYIAEAKEELDRRAQYVWDTIERAYSSLSGKYTSDLRADLNSEGTARVRGEVLKIVAIVNDRLKHAVLRPHQGMVMRELVLAGNEHERRIAVKVDYYLDKLSRGGTPTAAGATVVTVHGNVTSLQTGDRSVAHVVINQGASADLITALDNLRGEAERAHDAAATDRQDLFGMIDDIKQALTTSRPSSARIYGLLSGVGQVVQTIGSTAAAWQLVKAAAAAAGIQVP
jgi:predicted transcriptional regulator